VNPIQINCPLCERVTTRPGTGVQTSQIAIHDWSPILREVCAASGLTMKGAWDLRREGRARVWGR